VRDLYRPAGLSTVGEAMTWSAGLLLAVSSFTNWYSGTPVEGPTLSVIGWHTGALGKLVFVAGLIVVAIVAFRVWFELELPRTVPEPLVVIAVGTLSTIFVLIRVITIPDFFAATPGRGIGIWISLLAAVAVIAAGLLRAAEEF
jgi:hypothetical protein